MPRKRYRWFAISLFLILLSACSMQALSSGQDPTAVIETRVAELVASTALAQTALAQGVSATLTALANDAPVPNLTALANDEPAPNLTPEITFTPESSFTPTIPLALTPEVPMVSVSVQTFCRAGPGTVYELLGSLDVGQSAQVVGRSIDNETWIIKLPSNPGITCWLWGRYASVSGNTEALPKVDTPATPTATRAPTGVGPVSNVNLKAGSVTLNPTNPICSQSFTVGFEVVNTGSEPTPSSGSVSLIDIRVANGHQEASTLGGFPVLQPGQTFQVNMPLTVSAWYNEVHKLTLTIDPSNMILESDEGDNVRNVKYTLQRGSCP